MNKVLVAFFSATGNTAKIAGELAALESADLFEIRPEQPYTAEDLDYNIKDCRANREMQDESCRPAMVEKVENMDKYDVVFVGTPIWWGREASIIDTFLDAHNFTGKKIIPFCTSGISGVEKAAEHIRGIVGDGVAVEPGKRLGADGSEEEVRTWTDLLGL
ncbi:MAG: NAD(P)H-dependent oxidoreductase [Oscillospiraceae bacterium]|nr:NAD(P)H-dependent oxidoreductase [Oscillospiraceae bacterium]